MADVKWVAVVGLACFCVLGGPDRVRGQTYDYPGRGGTFPATAPATTQAAAPASALTPAELEQVVAPVALYPDSLLAQVLMAATYPLEVVQAERWAKANPGLKSSADALNQLTWEPSVKSLIDFPQVLTMMSEKLDWTVKLGDAFLADQKAVMEAVQRLRAKAYAQGNLASTGEQKVTVEPAPAAAATPAPPASDAAPPSSSTQVIVIESSDPEVVYVPTYNPTVVYGPWPYPSYPPYYYYPPGYVAGTAMISFGIGVACGAAWGHAWGDCDWHGGDVEIDIDQNVNFNGNIDREKYKAERDARQTERQGNRDTRQADRQGSRSTFQHDPSHRQGVSYRDTATTERFRGTNSSLNAAQAREAYRGRSEMGRTQFSGAGAGAARDYTAPRRGTGSSFAGSGTSGAGQLRDYSGTRSSGFSGVNSNASTARAASSRGQVSRSSYASSGNRSSGGYSRSSGGGSRGGGGYAGGGRAGGGRAGGGGRGGGRR